MDMAEEPGHVSSHAPPSCCPFFSPSLLIRMSTSSANPITQRVVSKMKKKNGQTTAESDDPTEGDRRRWATGCKFQFLDGRLPLWRDARDGVQMSSFYTRITLLFIRHFGWEHALDVDGTGPPGEPSEEGLEQVLDPAGLTDEQLATRNVVYLELRGVRTYLLSSSFGADTSPSIEASALVPLPRYEVAQVQQVRQLSTQDHQGVLLAEQAPS